MSRTSMSMPALARRARTLAEGRSLVFLAVATLCMWPFEVLARAPQAEHVAEHDPAGGEIEWVTPIIGNTGKLGLLWSLINFAVLLWILEKILFKPLRNRTRDKHDTVKAEIDRATVAREQAESVLAEYQGRLGRLDDEIAELLAEAKGRAEADRLRILEAAQREAEQITTAARATAERESAARRRQLEAEIIDRAVARAEVLLRQRITPADQRGMVDHYVEQLGAVDFGGRPS